MLVSPEMLMRPTFHQRKELALPLEDHPRYRVLPITTSTL